MKRRLLKVVFWLSVSMGLIVALLWTRSYFSWDVLRYGWDRGQAQVIASSVRGRILFKFSDDLDRGPRGIRYMSEAASVYLEVLDPNRSAWFGYTNDDGSGYRVSGSGSGPPTLGSWTSRSLLFPHVAMLLAAALPAILIGLVGRWRNHGRREGYCAHCGYDLRATPTRCPECGAAA